MPQPRKAGQVSAASTNLGTAGSFFRDFADASRNNINTAVNTFATAAGTTSNAVVNALSRQGTNRGQTMGSNPNAKINEGIVSSTQLPYYNFPSDLPRYHFGLIEAQIQYFAGSGLSGVNNTLQAEREYRLPLPSPIVDNFSVAYDPNFNMLDSSLGGTALGAAINNLGGGAAGAALGLALNRFKMVTLAQPEFRRIQFQWKLAPRNRAESEAILQITRGMRAGMTPDSVLADLLLLFPKVYIPYFYPNSRYLYKFKPCVIENISVDYNGGNPVPSFYQSDDPESAPPESIMLSVTFLELEYWLYKDYATDSGDIPSAAEFDNWNYYKLENVGKDV